MKSTAVAEAKQQKKAANGNPTGRKVLRDAWLAPVAMEDSAKDLQAHTDGLRCSDKGFLNLSLKEYASLLRWTSVRGALDGQEPMPQNCDGTAIEARH